MLRDALDSAQLNAKAVSVEDSPQPTRRLAHARIGIPYRAALYAFGLVPEGLKVRCEPIERDGAWIATLRFTIVKRERS